MRNKTKAVLYVDFIISSLKNKFVPISIVHVRYVIYNIHILLDFMKLKIYNIS